MKIRERVWVADQCVICGASSWAKLRAQAVLACKGDPGVADERQCLEREDHVGELRPEPQRRQYASESFDEIGARVTELEKERQSAGAAPSMDYGDCCG